MLGTDRMAQRSQQPQKLSFPSWLQAALLVAAIVLTYSPLWSADYIWDDGAHLTDNPCVIGPLGPWQIWTTPAASICPLVLTTFWVEHAIWGLQPLPYHLVNVLFHAGSAIVLWRTLLALRIPGACLGAALWVLHPLQVESVAWISEMKNTESGLFFLLAVLFYARTVTANEPVTGRNHLLVLLFAALAMTAKFSCAILPLSLWLCAWWIDGRWIGRRLISLWPIFLMAAITSAVTFWMGSLQPQSIDPGEVLNAPQRLAVAGDVTWFYLFKLLWPYPLMAIYPRWTIDPTAWQAWLPTLAVIVTSAVLWTWQSSWARPFFFAWAWFLIGLLPFLGLIDQSFWRFSFVEDHLQNLAAMGPCALAGAGLLLLSRIPAVRIGIGALVLSVLGVMSWKRTFDYHDDKTLWTDELAKNPNSWVTYANLGNYEFLHEHAADALTRYDQAIEHAPSVTALHNDRGNALLHLGRYDESIAAYQQSVRLQPGFALGYMNLGHALDKRGDLDGALKYYRQAATIDPNLAKIHVSLGSVHFRKGRFAEAVAEYEKAVKADPDDYRSADDLGLALMEIGQPDAASTWFHKIIHNHPDYPDAHFNLGNVLAQAGRIDDAIAEYAQALRFDPHAASAQKNLGLALVQKGRVAEALPRLQQAVLLEPSDPVGHNDLGIALSLSGDAAGALAQFKEALRLKPDYAEAASNLKRAESTATTTH